MDSEKGRYVNYSWNDSTHPPSWMGDNHFICILYFVSSLWRKRHKVNKKSLIPERGRGNFFIFSFDFFSIFYIFSSLNWYLVSFMKIEAILKKYGKKVTPERLQLFKQMKKMHLFESKQLIEVFPDMWRASIFRNIKLFCDIGILRRIYLWENHEKYEIECCETHHHEHMKCMECGNILSFDSKNICKQIFSQAEKYWFHISEHSVNILGTCSLCQQ